MAAVDNTMMGDNFKQMAPASNVTLLDAVQSDDYRVVVQFGRRVPPDLQGVALLAMEKLLREAGCPACVEKATKADDSKLRLRMTDEERQKL